MTPAEGAMVALEDRASVPATIALVTAFDGTCPEPDELRARVLERWLPLPALHRRVRLGRDGRPVRPYAWAPAAGAQDEVAGQVRLLDPVADPAGHVAGLLGRPLPPGGPLWGLDLLPDPGAERFTLVLRTHHALLDGTSVSTLTRLLSDDPAAEAPPGAALSPVPDGVAARAGAALGALRGLVPPARPRPYNRPVDTTRAIARATVPAAAVDAARDALPRGRATVNDVFLAAVAGALRHELPSGNVHTLVPVSMRGPGEAALLGNAVAAVRAPLPVSLTTPAARLRAVHTAMSRAKRQRWAAGFSGTTGALAVVAPGTAGTLTGRLLGVPALWNLLCSAIRLSDRPLALAGRPMREAYVLTCLPPRMGFVYVLTRYHDTYTLGLTGDGAHGPRLDGLARAAREEITSLAART
ncbi:WS/DGAT domain-containing protein [Streptomyces litchfieldiae]|uniref:diacylglycerol O-acyltransferase n=1 Tax=Streptomyces litchfieldiae TaxID=3075543 RepID=A0ABU2MPH1_9ACTN|nr:WS/DGAT domain-containing protein [Streptomyces sp. DSM 44938]MDT0343517.1 WS/DGAT domain-containing protein [Streptomyces sp. DSM 44938]